jgi:hypothetical protein
MFLKKKVRQKKWGLRFKIKVALWALCLLSILPVVNWIYHIAKNPSQVLSPFQKVMSKTPASTWHNYESDFRENSTAIMTPEFLAALAQSESAGNPTAQPYWRWDFSSNPFEIYSPASSSSGLFQITHGTFEEAKKFCIHNGQVMQTGPWHKFNSCWFNWTYTRLSASDSIEMISARLHYLVEKFVGRTRMDIRKKQEVAAIIHLCGPGKALSFIKRGAKGLGYCGDHHVGSYLNRIRALEKRFVALRNGKAKDTQSLASISN